MFKKRAQAAMSLGYIAQRTDQKIEISPDFGLDFAARHKIDPGRGQFEGQWHTFHQLADVHQPQFVGLGQGELRMNVVRALDE